MGGLGTRLGSIKLWPQQKLDVTNQICGLCGSHPVSYSTITSRLVDVSILFSTTIFNNCIPRQQFEGCSATRPFLPTKGVACETNGRDTILYSQWRSLVGGDIYNIFVQQDFCLWKWGHPKLYFCVWSSAHILLTYELWLALIWRTEIVLFLSFKN